MNIAKVIFSRMTHQVAFLTLAGLLAMPATAQVNYAVSASTAYVTSSPNASGNVVIDSTYNGYPVTSIVDSAFQNCTNLTSATIPNSVTNVWGGAFQNCSSLTNVTIPNSLTSIRGSTFFGCTSLTSVTIPDSVTNIAGEAFSFCTSLTNFSVGAANSVYSSLDGILFNKAQTTLIQFPRGRDGSYAISNSVTSIGAFAFSSCTSLTNVTIPNSVTSIGRFAFSSCTSLTSVTIPNSVTSIGDVAFSSCISLTSVTIGNSVTYIGFAAFNYCTNLTSVTIPNSVTFLIDAFLYCNGMTNYSVGAANSVYSSLDGVLFDKAQTTLIQFPAGRGGSYAVPNSVTTIGRSAFPECHRLTSVTIPNSVTSVGYGAFSSCTSLTNILVGAANSVYSSLDGVLFNKAQTTLVQFPGGRGGSYAIPNSVTNIVGAAFSGSVNLTNVTIGNGITIIDTYAFANCYSLTSVTIPNNVTIIDQAAFSYCTSLTSVTIPNSVTGIRNGAFNYCTNLTNVTIGNGVTDIEDNAFASCASLPSVTIPNSVASIGYSAFFNCTSLTNFSVDAANSAYSSLDGVLFNKAQTQIIQFPSGRSGSYTAPNSVAYIADFAFYSSTRLTNVTFLGNAPYLNVYGSAFDLAAGVMVYYYYGTTGWWPTFAGLPTVMLGAPAPQVGAGSVGVKPGGFGFTLNGVVNQTIVIEASTNLANWQPIWTSTLSAVATNFVDPNWVNHPHRFYRAQSY